MPRLEQVGTGVRFYRHWATAERETFRLVHRETDLWIQASASHFQACLAHVKALRCTIDTYIAAHPAFASSLESIAAAEDAPVQVQLLASTASAVGVGPMAGIAGLFAQEVGKLLLQWESEVVVENGGDLFLSAAGPCQVALYAGPDSPFSGRVGVRLHPQQMPLGVCTSAGSFGHSYSAGSADAVMALSPCAVLADCAATAAANRVQREADIQDAVEWLSRVDGITGALAAKGTQMAAWGAVELFRITGRQVD